MEDNYVRSMVLLAVCALVAGANDRDRGPELLCACEPVDRPGDKGLGEGLRRENSGGRMRLAAAGTDAGTKFLGGGDTIGVVIGGARGRREGVLAPEPALEVGLEAGLLRLRGTGDTSRLRGGGFTGARPGDSTPTREGLPPCAAAVSWFTVSTEVTAAVTAAATAAADVAVSPGFELREGAVTAPSVSSVCTAVDLDWRDTSVTPFASTDSVRWAEVGAGAGRGVPCSPSAANCSALRMSWS